MTGRFLQLLHICQLRQLIIILTSNLLDIQKFYRIHTALLTYINIDFFIISKFKNDKLITGRLCLH